MEENDKILDRKLIANLHTSLEVDPVIAKYMKSAGQNENHVPRYSDKLLQSSLRAIHVSSADNNMTLNLYRRLVAFYYSATFHTVNTLAGVMKIFTKSEIIQIFNDVDNTLTCWDKFIKSTLLPLLFRDTFLEIMKEWAKRYELVHVRPLEGVEEQARKVLTYLYWDHKYLQSWLEIFNSTELRAEQYQYTTEQQLDIKVIVEDLRNSFNPLIHKYVLCSLPLDAMDQTTKSPLRNIAIDEGHAYNDEITIKEEYIEPSVVHSIENPTLSIENRLDIESVEHNQTNGYDEQFNGNDNYLHTYDNSIVAMGSSNNEFPESCEASEIFVINEFDMGEEVNTCYDTRGRIGIQKTTALRYINELRLYARQTGLLQIIEQLNEIALLISRTSDAERSREYRRRKKQREEMELYLRQEFSSARNSNSLSTPATSITPSTARSENKKSNSGTPIDKNSANNKNKPYLINSNFPIASPELKKPKKSNAVRMREYRARKKLREQQAAMYKIMDDYVADTDTVDLTTEHFSDPLSNNVNPMQYNNQIAESALLLNASQSNVGMTLQEEVCDVRLRNSQTSTKRSRNCRAKKVEDDWQHNASKQQEQNVPNFNLLEVIPIQNDVNKRKTSTERTRKWRERKRVFANSKSQSKSAAVRSREYRARKKSKDPQSYPEVFSNVIIPHIEIS